MLTLNPDKNGTIGNAEEAVKTGDDRVAIKRPLIGLASIERKEVVHTLNRVLANEMILTTKIRKVHWDVAGPQFYALHKMLDEHYKILDGRADEIAERVRQLGAFPVATLSGFLEHAVIGETPGIVLNPTEAVEALLMDHELLIRTLRNFLSKSDLQFDYGTTDLYTRILLDHERMAWMLRAFIEGEGVRSRPDARTSIPDFA